MNKKNLILSIFTIVFLIITTFGVTYAFFQAQIGEGATQKVEVKTSTTDLLWFETKDGISFKATQDNFSQESLENPHGTTTASAFLSANNDTNEATQYYNIYININSNDFDYSLSEENPELILKVIDPNGNEITSDIAELTYFGDDKSLEDINGNVITGFDITKTQGLIKIASEYPIVKNVTDQNPVSQEWSFEVMLVNYDANQNANTGKLFDATIVITKAEITSHDDITYTAFFDSNDNGENDTVLNCTAVDENCTVITPEIERSGYEILGWSQDENAETVEIGIDEEITLTSDTTYYAITRKNIDATFTVQDPVAISADYETDSCYLYNTNESCSITTPTLTANDGYTALGWNKTSDATSATINNNTVIDISNDTTYYSITRNDTPLTTSYTIQDSNAVSYSGGTGSCYLYNGEDGCSVTPPLLTAKGKYEVLGWNTNAEATEATVLNGADVTIYDSNQIFYTMTKYDVVVTFDKNITFDNNTVAEGEEGYSYANTNIAADSLSFETTTCTSYNGKGCYIDDVPIIYSVGNEVYGFSIEPDSSSIYNARNILFKQDYTLYARVFNMYSQNTFVPSYYTQIGNVVVEAESGTNYYIALYYFDYLYQLNIDMPELFYMKGKMRLLSDETYVNYHNETSGGVTLDLLEYSLVDIRLYDIEEYVYEYTLFTYVHELAHAFDNLYNVYTGSKMRTRDDIVSLYNTYYALDSTNRPLRDYAFSSVAEFIADSYAVYYGETYEAYNYETNGLTPEIISFVEKYSCIARNKFDEEAVCE